MSSARRRVRAGLASGFAAWCSAVIATVGALSGCTSAGPHVSDEPVPHDRAGLAARPFAGGSGTSSATAPLAAPSGSTHAAARTDALDVPGFLPAVVEVPGGSARVRPAVVVTHGAGGRPEPHCARYAEIVAGRAFVLCTRGRAADLQLPEPERGFFYDGHVELGREVLAALEALRAAFPREVDADRAIFAGYSQGASMGLLFLHQRGEHAARFAGALLVEGGAADWNVALSRRMRDVGLRRVAIVCGQKSCKESMDRSLGWMKKGGLEVLPSYAPGAGHTYGGAVAPLVEEAFAWVTSGDARFEEP